MSRIFDLRTSRVSTVWSTYLCLELKCMSCMSCMIHIARIFRVLYYVAWVLYTINSTYHIIHSTLIHVPLGGMGICVMAHGSRTHKFAGMGTVWHDSCTNDTYMRSFAPVGAEMICSALLSVYDDLLHVRIRSSRTIPHCCCTTVLILQYVLYVAWTSFVRTNRNFRYISNIDIPRTFRYIVSSVFCPPPWY